MIKTRARLLCLLLCLLASTALAANEPLAYGGTDADLLMSAAMLPDGGLLLGGNTYSNDGLIDGRLRDPYCNAWALRLDADGEVLWDILYGDQNGVHYFDMVMALSDGTILLGYSYYKEQEEKRLLTVSPTGEILADEAIDLPGAQSFAAAEDGYLILGCDRIERPFAQKDRSIPFIARYDGDGHQQWYQAYDALYDCTLEAAHVPDGFLLHGSFAEEGGAMLPVAARLDADGNLLWLKKLPQYTSGAFDALAPAPDGGVVAIGLHAADWDVPPVGHIVRFTKDGGIQWEKTFLLDNTQAPFQGIVPWEDAYVVISPVAQTPSVMMHLFSGDGEVQQVWVRDLLSTQNALNNPILYAQGDGLILLDSFPPRLGPTSTKSFMRDYDIVRTVIDVP